MASALPRVRRQFAAIAVSTVINSLYRTAKRLTCGFIAPVEMRVSLRINASLTDLYCGHAICDHKQMQSGNARGAPGQFI